MEADRRLLHEARKRLSGWTYTARDRAYRELFAGDDAAVTAEERQLLDEVDAGLAGDDNDGLWRTDEYAAVIGHPKNHPILVICARRPGVPSSWSRDGESLTESEHEQSNGLLWDYCERARRYAQDEVDEFIGVTGVPEE